MSYLCNIKFIMRTRMLTQHTYTHTIRIIDDLLPLYRNHVFNLFLQIALKFWQYS